MPEGVYYCTKCGQANAVGGRFCESCGAPRYGSSQIRERNAQAQTRDSQARDKGLDWALIAMGTVLAAALVVSLVAFAVHRTTNDELNVTTGAQAPRTLLAIYGSGSKSTEKFTTTGEDWNLTYSYDCSEFGMSGNFQVFIFNGDGSPSWEYVGVNQLGTSGSDVDYYHTGGTFYLVINSLCRWHVRVDG